MGLELWRLSRWVGDVDMFAVVVWCFGHGVSLGYIHREGEYPTAAKTPPARWCGDLTLTSVRFQRGVVVERSAERARALVVVELVITA